MQYSVLALSAGALAAVIVVCAVLFAALVGIIVFAAVRFRRAEEPRKQSPQKKPEKKSEARPARAKTPASPSAKTAAEPAKPPVSTSVQDKPVAHPQEAAPAPHVHALDTELVMETETEEGARAYDVNKHRFLFVRFNRSYEARLIQARDSVKRYYEELKNELLSYRGVKSRTGWKGENFRKGRVHLARLRVRGKLLCLYLALDPKDYIGTKYKVEDVSDVAANQTVPTLYRMKNDRRCAYAKDLISVVMAREGIVRGDGTYVPYAANLPYEETDPLIERRLIRLVEDESLAETAAAAPVRHTVKAAEAHELLEDTVAAAMIEEAAESIPARKIGNGRTGIINVDTLSDVFAPGERVTLEEIKARVPFFDKRATAVKVLARGIIDKPLTVEADDFSLDAVKMIVLTGGHAVHLKH